MNQNQIYPKLGHHLEQYRQYLSSVKHYSPHTINAYLNDLSTFSAFFKKQPGDWRERQYLTGFLKHLFKNKYSNNSIYRYRCSLSNFFEYLSRREVVESSPIHLMGRYKRRNLTPRVWPQSQVNRVLSKLNKGSGEQVSSLSSQYREERDILITEILYGLGLRISELTSLQLKHINTSEGIVMVWGKGGRHELLPLTPRIVGKLRKYLVIRRKFITETAKDHDHLLCNHHGSPLSIRGVRHAFQQRLRKNGEEAIHPHALRHSLAGHLLENGAGIRQVQKVLRHRSLSSTQVYTQVSSQLLKKQYLKNHPLSSREKNPNPGNGDGGT